MQPNFGKREETGQRGKRKKERETNGKRPTSQPNPSALPSAEAAVGEQPGQPRKRVPVENRSRCVRSEQRCASVVYRKAGRAESVDGEGGRMDGWEGGREEDGEAQKEKP